MDHFSIIVSVILLLIILSGVVFMLSRIAKADGILTAVAIVAALIGTALFVHHNLKAQAEWQKFAVEHKCKIVNQVSGKTEWACKHGAKYWR